MNREEYKNRTFSFSFDLITTEKGAVEVMTLVEQVIKNFTEDYPHTWAIENLKGNSKII